MADQRLPTVDSDDGVWGEILNQFLEKEHYNTGTNNAANGGHKTITIRPGTATAGTAPLKFTSGTLLGTPEAGAMEFLTDHLYFTITTGAVRKTLAMYDDTSGTTGDIYYRDSSGNFTRLAIGSPGDVLKVNSGLPSWGAVSASAGGSSGQMQYNNGGALGGTAGFTYQSGASPNVTIQAQNAAYIPIVVKAAGSQSVNLQEWQDSSNNPLFTVTKEGYTQGPNGAQGTPTFSFTGDPDTGVFLSTTNTLGISAGGTERLTVSTTQTSITHDLDVAGHAAFGPGATAATDTVIKITETYTSNSGSLTGFNTSITTDPTAASTAGATGGIAQAKSASGDANGAASLMGIQGRADHDSSGSLGAGYGVYGYVGAGGSSGAIGTALGVIGQVDNFSGNTFTTAIGVAGIAKNAGSGTITSAIGVTGQVTSEGGGTLAAATAISAQNTLTGTGNITESFGIQVANPTDSGAGTIGTNIGIYVHPMTSGSTNLGLSIGVAGTQTLVVGASADSTTANAGIAFGTSRDTNLYRFAASTLATDDDFNIKGGKALKIDGGTSGTVTVQTAATAGTWTLTLPTDDGASGQMLKTNGSGVTSWGDVTFNTSTKTADYTVATSDTVILADATSGNVTITMPAASGASGYRFFIKRIDNSSNTVNVARSGSDTIDGQTSQSIAQQYTSLTLVSNGSNWFII